MGSQVVGQAPQGQLPQPVNPGDGQRALSDLQRMMRDEQAQHMGAYKYANGNTANSSTPLGEPSF
jgi:hypothetical protein